MNAMVFRAEKEPLEWESRPELQPNAGQVVVRLQAAALNRRDYWITQGMYPGIRPNVILGSDGAGVVTRMGSGVEQEWAGRDVIINPGWEWGSDSRFQSPAFRILGMPEDGTFATEVLVPAQYLHHRPAWLSWAEAAALPLAGVTAFRATVTQGQVQAGETMMVTGIGGGVATMALQFGLAKGARVLVTSSSPDKIQRAIQLGAAAGFDYRAEKWHEQVKAEFGGVDLVVDSAGGDNYNQLLDLLRPGGRIVNYGATAGPPRKLDLFKVFWKQVRIQGSTMGSPQDFIQMLELVHQEQIRPVVDQVFALSDANLALQKMRDSQQFGKLVLQC